MVRTPSTMLPLGTEAPSFDLPDASGRRYTLDAVAGEKGTVVAFICNHCPFVIHVEAEIAALAREAAARGVGFVAINANDVDAYPDDAPDKMAEKSAEAGYDFPYLFDESQQTAAAYRAACTPDFFLFDADRRLVYRGQLDGSRPGNEVPVTGEDLRAAIAAVVAGEPVAADQRPSLGCNIKWRPGNEPSYFG